MNNTTNCIRGVAAILNESDISTDIIAPAAFMITTSRSGLAKGLFYNWRYLENGNPDPSFVLNRSQFFDASILIAGANFGCGSSREHAVWALVEFGIRAVIAPSFSETFSTNSAKNGLATIVLLPNEILQLSALEKNNETTNLDIKLEDGTVVDSRGNTFGFELSKEQRSGLIEGLDDVRIAIDASGLIKRYYHQRKRDAPWIVPNIG